MEPFELRTERLVLDQPVADDAAAMAAYCADPVFERFMATPWPYELEHAKWFIETGVPEGWATGREWNWAIRREHGSPLLGVIGIRLFNDMIGYWLGAEHRGQKIMSEAARAVVDAYFERTEQGEVLWECVQGNIASLRVAQDAGFSYTGAAQGIIPARDGSLIPSWTARISRDIHAGRTTQDPAHKTPWPA